MQSQFQAHQAIQASGSFENYSTLATSLADSLPVSGIIFGAVMIIGVASFRLGIQNKQNRAEDKGKISKDDQSKYLPKESKDGVVSSDTTSSTKGTVSPIRKVVNNSSNTENTNASVTSPITGGADPDEDLHAFLEKYIDDLYKASIEGDDILRNRGLGGLVDHNYVPTLEEALEIYDKFMSNF
jgi:hypothetical protein